MTSTQAAPLRLLKFAPRVVPRDEQQLLAVYRQMTPEAKETLRQLADHMVPRTNRPKEGAR